LQTTVVPSEYFDRRRPVWVVPDSVPAIVPRSARLTEPQWVAVFLPLGSSRGRPARGRHRRLDRLADQIRYQVGGAYLVFGSLLPLAWVAAVAMSKGYEPRFFGAGPDEFRSILRSGAG